MIHAYSNTTSLTAISGMSESAIDHRLMMRTLREIQSSNEAALRRFILRGRSVAHMDLSEKYMRFQQTLSDKEKARLAMLDVAGCMGPLERIVIEAGQDGGVQITAVFPDRTKKVGQAITVEVAYWVIYRSLSPTVTVCIETGDLYLVTYQDATGLHGWTTLATSSENAICDLVEHLGLVDDATLQDVSATLMWQQLCELVDAALPALGDEAVIAMINMENGMSLEVEANEGSIAASLLVGEKFLTRVQTMAELAFTLAGVELLDNWD